MRRRILISAAVFVAITTILLGGYWLLQPRPRIDEETCNKIEIGMTEREVIDLIGSPPGNYGLGEATIMHKSWIYTREPAGKKDWLGPKTAIRVVFDDDGKVRDKCLYDVWREYDSVWDMALVMLHLKERRLRVEFEITDIK
jgi:hypothetical protein